TTSTGPRSCIRVTGGQADVDTGSLAGDAMTLAGEIFVCADDVVVVSPDDLHAVLAGAQLAAALKAPLLIPDPLLASELGRLHPKRVHAIRGVEVTLPPGADLEKHTVLEALDAAARALG